MLITLILDLSSWYKTIGGNYSQLSTFTFNCHNTMIQNCIMCQLVVVAVLFLRGIYGTSCLCFHCRAVIAGNEEIHSAAMPSQVDQFLVQLMQIGLFACSSKNLLQAFWELATRNGPEGQCWSERDIAQRTVDLRVPLSCISPPMWSWRSRKVPLPPHGLFQVVYLANGKATIRQLYVFLHKVFRYGWYGTLAKWGGHHVPWWLWFPHLSL